MLLCAFWRVLLNWDHEILFFKYWSVSWFLFVLLFQFSYVKWFYNFRFYLSVGVRPEFQRRRNGNIDADPRQRWGRYCQLQASYFSHINKILLNLRTKHHLLVNEVNVGQLFTLFCIIICESDEWSKTNFDIDIYIDSKQA